MDTLELYVVRSKDGKYLRAKGYAGTGESWVTDLKKAKIYPKLSTARSQVTFWAGNYPKFGVPDIIKLTITASEVIDETSRVDKALLKKRKIDLQNELHSAKWELDRALKEASKARQQNAQTWLLKAQKLVNTLEQQLETFNKK